MRGWDPYCNEVSAPPDHTLCPVVHHSGEIPTVMKRVHPWSHPLSSGAPLRWDPYSNEASVPPDLTLCPVAHHLGEIPTVMKRVHPLITPSVQWLP